MPLAYINAVNNTIANLGQEWDQHKALFLTEDDIKSRLIEELRHIEPFGNYAQTEGIGVRTRFAHFYWVKFYGKTVTNWIQVLQHNN